MFNCCKQWGKPPLIDNNLERFTGITLSQIDFLQGLIDEDHWVTYNEIYATFCMEMTIRTIFHTYFSEKNVSCWMPHCVIKDQKSKRSTGAYYTLNFIMKTGS